MLRQTRLHLLPGEHDHMDTVAHPKLDLIPVSTGLEERMGGLVAVCSLGLSW